MAVLNAITNDALLSIVEWGENVLRNPGAGETAWVLANVDDVDQIVIDANGPAHTKVVADVATEMTTPEKDAVDAAALVILQAANMVILVDTLDGNLIKEHDVTGPVVIDWAQPDHKLVMAANLGAGDITFSNSPAAGMARYLTVEILQGTPGEFTIDADAWPASVDWGTKAAPVFGEVIGSVRLLRFYFNGSRLCGSYESNVYGGPPPGLLYGATDLTTANHWRDAVNAGQDMLTTKCSRVIMYRYNSTPTSGRKLAGQGRPTANGGWMWETTTANEIRIAAIRGDDAIRSINYANSLGFDYIAISEVDVGLLKLYSHESAIAHGSTDLATVKDDGTLFSAVGTNSAANNSQAPPGCITVYGEAISTTSLVSEGPGILAYCNACIAAGKVLDYTGATRVRNIPVSLGPMIDEVGSPQRDLPLVGEPTLVTGVTPNFK